MDDTIRGSNPLLSVYTNNGAITYTLDNLVSFQIIKHKYKIIINKNNSFNNKVDSTLDSYIRSGKLYKNNFYYYNVSYT